MLLQHSMPVLFSHISLFRKLYRYTKHGMVSTSYSFCLSPISCNTTPVVGIASVFHAAEKVLHKLYNARFLCYTGLNSYPLNNSREENGFHQKRQSMVKREERRSKQEHDEQMHVDRSSRSGGEMCSHTSAVVRDQESPRGRSRHRC
jgi:hypothetical protein